jgi:hypothetical protein
MTERDEILEQEAREQLEESGMDEDNVDAALDEMREGGAFDVPQW